MKNTKTTKSKGIEGKYIRRRRRQQGDYDNECEGKVKKTLEGRRVTSDARAVASDHLFHTTALKHSVFFFLSIKLYLL